MLPIPNEIASMIVDQIASNGDDLHAFSSASRQTYALGTHNIAKTTHLTLDLRDQRAIREARALRIIQAPLEVRSLIRTLTIKSSVSSLDDDKCSIDREKSYVGPILALVSALPELTGLKLVNLPFDAGLGSRLSARLTQFCTKLDTLIVDGVGGDMRSIQDLQLSGLKKFIWTWSVGPPPAKLLRASADTLEELELDFHHMINDYSSEDHISSFVNLTFPRLRALKLLPVASDLEVEDQCYDDLYAIRRKNRAWDHPAHLDPTENDTPHPAFQYDPSQEDEEDDDEEDTMMDDGGPHPPSWVRAQVTNFILRHPTIRSLSMGEYSSLELDNDSFERAVLEDWVKQSSEPIFPNLETLRASHANISFLATECPTTLGHLKSLTVIFDENNGDLVPLIRLIAPHTASLESITIERTQGWLEEMIVEDLVNTIRLLAPGEWCPKFSELVYVGQPEGDEANDEPADQAPLIEAGKQHNIKVTFKEVHGPIEFKSDDVL